MDPIGAPQTMVGQIYLQDNPLLETPLKLEHIKLRLLGLWARPPGSISTSTT